MFLSVPPQVYIDQYTVNSTYKVREGETLTLTCSVVKVNPEVRVDGFSWSFQKQGSRQEERVPGSASRLVIADVEAVHSGRYTCQAWSYVRDTCLLPPGRASIEVEVLCKSACLCSSYL